MVSKIVKFSVDWYVVMQFAGQHPGGLGVPAVGMAFPGYVAQPNGMGNSEMTWYYNFRFLCVIGFAL